MEKLNEITITQSGVSVRVDTVAFDENGNEIGIVKSKRKAIGVNDFAEDPTKPTEAEKAAFKTALNGFTESELGRDVSALITECKVDQDVLANAKQSLENEKAANRTLSKANEALTTKLQEQTALREKLATELAQATDENNSIKARTKRILEELDKAQVGMEVLKNDWDELAANNELLKAEKNILQAEKTGLIQAGNEMRKEIENLKAKLEA